MEFETDMQAQAFSQVFNQYKAQAKRRNLEFLLSKSEMFYLIKSDCYLCGEKPGNVSVWNNYILYSPLKPIGPSQVSIVYNGIDRKDNNIGYTKENSYPCCKRCNMAKKNFTFESFLQWIKQINENITNAK